MSRISFMAIGAGIGLGISLSDCNNSFIQHTFYDPQRILLRSSFHHRHVEPKEETKEEVNGQANEQTDQDAVVDIYPAKDGDKESELK